MSSTKWNPQKYEKFKGQRSKPFSDLTDLLQKKPMGTAVDLGCGTGELTRLLFDQIQPTYMLGIDTSPEMLSKSNRFETSGLDYQLQDISSYNPNEKLDLVFSNAALQWLPDHENLIPKVLSWVKDGGQVAIQMPYNFEHPSHLIAKKVAVDLFPDIFRTTELRSMLTLERYSEMLFDNGFENQVARIQVYGHPMKSSYEVIEWTKGTLLTGYQSKLDENQFHKFLDQYENELLEIIGGDSYYYAFKRLLLWGTKNVSYNK